MGLFDIFSNKYKNHSEGVIISCFFNPTKSEYRLKAFNKWYSDIKHMNHLIYECVIGDAEFQLPENPNILRIRTESLLWHKETLLNKLIEQLPKQYKYVFWIDADVIFTNKNWMVDAVKNLKGGNQMVQLFEYCIHLDEGEYKPHFDYEGQKYKCFSSWLRHPQMWRSFAANYVDQKECADSLNYDTHGHVGFAWGATRELLERVPLYDRALVGGADHIIAHAAARQLNHNCIVKSFTDDLEEVNLWSKIFDAQVHGRLGYVKGDLFHIWHGDLKKRQYLKRIQEFTPKAKQSIHRGPDGLYTSNNPDVLDYVIQYFMYREIFGQQYQPNVFEFGGGNFGGGGAGVEVNWEQPPAGTYVATADPIRMFLENGYTVDASKVDAETTYTNAPDLSNVSTQELEQYVNENFS